MVQNLLTAFYTFPAVILRYSIFFISHLPTGNAGKREIHSVFVIKCQREGERKGRSRACNDVKKQIFVPEKTKTKQGKENFRALQMISKNGKKTKG